MSKYDYDCSRKISLENYPFYAIIMSAFRQADPDNLAKLKDIFPDIFVEFEQRYYSRGGFLATDEVYTDNVKVVNG